MRFFPLFLPPSNAAFRRGFASGWADSAFFGNRPFGDTDRRRPGAPAFLLPRAGDALALRLVAGIGPRTERTRNALALDTLRNIPGA